MLCTDNNAAWRISPMVYEAQRTVDYTITSPVSHYLAMRDGCRLAVDVYLPCTREHLRAEVERYATLVLFTPYYRRFDQVAGGSGECAPNIAKFRDYFVPRGYALVVVDVRGTGASFGTRDSFRSPRERDDSRAVVDWIVTQPWANGAVGATGISYLGAAADFLASTGHPAVRAIAPLFSVWDTYADNYYPGGMMLKALTQSYDDLMVALDHDQRELLRRFVYYANPTFAGPQAVDEDVDGKLLSEAVHEHRNNFRQTEFMPEFRFREEPLPYDPNFSSASFSPYSLAALVPERVAVLSVSGWFDGAGYANGAISRYLTLAKKSRYLLLGPWDHGARIHISPWRQTVEPEAVWLAAVLRFFDHHLLEYATGLDAEAPIHYYALRAETWRSAAQWPPYDPQKDEACFYLVSGAQLATTVPDSEVEVVYQSDFSIGTGTRTRYERIAAIDTSEYYSDWQGRTARLCNFTSLELSSAAELAGHAVIELWVCSSEPDAALFAYLTEIEADGTERYVTEGLLRLLHRQESDCPPNYQTTWPFRSFSRTHAQAMVPDVFYHIRLGLLPIAWQFSAGSRIRFSIAGADQDHCGQVPHGRPPRLRIGIGGKRASCIRLPWRIAL